MKRFGGAGSRFEGFGVLCGFFGGATILLRMTQWNMILYGMNELNF